VRPELFTIPLINLSIKSYGTMMVLGFLAGLWLARQQARRLGENPDNITNFSLYLLLSGVIGARIMHVWHNWDQIDHSFVEMIAIWNGGLEFLGGVIAAVVVMLWYFRRKKLPTLRYLDILAPALMLGLAFGRMGCLLNGCCFGATCDLPWAMRFPAVNQHNVGGCNQHAKTTLNYSYPFDYQLYPDPERRPGQGPLLTLPPDYYDGYTDGNRHWVRSLAEIPPGAHFYPAPKQPDELTESQLHDLTDGKIQMHPVHPSQIYSILTALLLCGVLSLLFRRRKREGQVFAWMLILYGPCRFGLESMRIEPLWFDGLTISQNLSIVATVAGIVMMIVLSRIPVILLQKLKA
jgi:phosphatidylglycerol---prolipoprotein diacylglyceryl transferase